MPGYSYSSTSETEYFPTRFRAQISGPAAYDGSLDALSQLPHTFEEDRVGCPPLLLLPLRSKVVDEARYFHSHTFSSE